ncbi:MAG: type II toxin-antitoxin system VapC family toxin [Balneolaceae bacterium]|nr:type II toxin-antitoxin system VapC family toxin [Balneolaceae bacterium]
MIVVDTNVIASLWVPNNQDELAYSVLKKDPIWVAPILWNSEFRNVLALYLRKKIFELSTAMQIIREAEELMQTQTYEVNSTRVLQLVNNSSCSSYDCEFVALATDLGVQMVTFDQKICSEFPDIAHHPQEFVE